MFAALYPVIWKLPVAVEHVGCVTAPAVGAAGVDNCVAIEKLDEAADVHVPFPAVTL